MKVIPGALPGLLRLIPSPIQDERGFFARTSTREINESHHLPPFPDHEAVAHNRLEGTLRGLHYQQAPFSEAKRVRCVRGAIWDVAVDLRPSSPTFLQWEAFLLDENNLESLFLPAGLAHGYLTLCDDTLVEYAIYHPYQADAASGLRWNDPRLGIRWPKEPRVMNARDAGWALL